MGKRYYPKENKSYVVKSYKFSYQNSDDENVVKDIPIKVEIVRNSFMSKVKKQTLQKMKEQNSRKSPLMEALKYFFEHQKIPLYEKIGVEEIVAYSDDIELRMNINWETFNLKDDLSINTGRYFFIRGIPIKPSRVSKKISYVLKEAEVSKKDIQNQIKDLVVTNQIILKKVSSGGSCYNIQITNNFNLFLDYSNPDISINPNLIFVSHAHKDHFQLPRQNNIEELIFIMSRVTLDFLFLKFQNKWNKMERVAKRTVIVKSDEVIKGGDISLEFKFAGHMPGALMFYLNIRSFTFLYTGDYSYHGTDPLIGLDVFNNLDVPNVDILLLDCAMVQYKLEVDHTRQTLPRLIDKINKFGKGIITGLTDSHQLVLLQSIAGYYNRHRRKTGRKKEIWVPSRILDYAMVLRSHKEGITQSLIEAFDNEISTFSSTNVKYYNINNIEYFQKQFKYRNKVFILNPPSELFDEEDLGYYQGKKNELNKTIRKDLIEKSIEDEDAAILFTGNLEHNYRKYEKDLLKKHPKNRSLLNNQKEFSTSKFNLHADFYDTVDFLNLFKPKITLMGHIGFSEGMKWHKQLIKKLNYQNETDPVIIEFNTKRRQLKFQSDFNKGNPVIIALGDSEYKIKY